MNNYLEKPFNDFVPIKYLCDISYNSTDKKIFVGSNEKFFSLEDLRNILENNGTVPKHFKMVDTVLFNKNIACLIEFKSGEYGNISTEDLKNQFVDCKKFFSFVKNCSICKFNCIVVIETFIYRMSENIKRLKKKPHSSQSFLRERIDKVNIDIKQNGMGEIRILTKNEFVKEYDIKLCDNDNTCDIKPKNIHWCEFKDI